MVTKKITDLITGLYPYDGSEYVLGVQGGQSVKLVPGICLNVGTGDPYTSLHIQPTGGSTIIGGNTSITGIVGITGNTNITGTVGITGDTNISGNILVNTITNPNSSKLVVNGTIESSSGGIRFPDNTLLTSANVTNLFGGSTGTIPYQSAADTTAMLAAGTLGQFLQSNGAAAPSWATLDFTSSKVANGYQKLPNGLIIQWYTTGYNTPAFSTSVQTLTFPIAFPTACLTVVAQTRQVYAGAFNWTFLTVNSWTVTTVTFDHTTARIFIAIGY